MNDNVQPPSPSTPDPMTFITEAVADLGVYLAMWANRGEQPTAAERAAAGEAVGRIDALIAQLHPLRSRLVTEHRQADDATMRRVDALLERLRTGDGVDSTLRTCPGCGAKVVGHETCGDPTRPACRGDR